VDKGADHSLVVAIVAYYCCSCCCNTIVNYRRSVARGIGYRDVVDHSGTDQNATDEDEEEEVSEVC